MSASSSSLFRACRLVMAARSISIDLRASPCNLDLHLPLGVGNIGVARHVRALKAGGYDGTITLNLTHAYRAWSGHVASAPFRELMAPIE